MKIKIYKRKILPVVLYGCEAWREERRLRVFENKILWWRIFGSQRDVNGECRKLRWAGHIDRMEESRSALKFSTDTPTGRRPRRR